MFIEYAYRNRNFICFITVNNLDFLEMNKFKTNGKKN